MSATSRAKRMSEDVSVIIPGLGWAGGGAAATALLLASSAVAGMAMFKAAPVPVALGIIGGIGAGVGAAFTGPMLAWALRHRPIPA